MKTLSMMVKNVGAESGFPLLTFTFSSLIVSSPNLQPWHPLLSIEPSILMAYAREMMEHRIGTLDTLYCLSNRICIYLYADHVGCEV